MSASVIRHALALAERFEAIHRHSVAQVRAGPGAGDVDAGVRDTLGAWEACVAAMLDALYAHPDLARLSDLFHMYQDELLAKREAYAAFVAQESDPSHFLSAWESLPHVEEGKRAELDDLADALAGLA